MSAAIMVFVFLLGLGPRQKKNITYDSKIDENRCKQKNELIQIMGDLYRY